MKLRHLAIGAGAVGLAYFVLVIASGLGANPTGKTWTFETIGQFGDAFGPLNTLMAGLAAAGAIGAYFSQKEELDRIKLEATIDRGLASKRDFEATFFNLIQLFRSTVDDIEVRDLFGENRATGRDAIQKILESHMGKPSGNIATDRAKYEKVYRNNRDDLGHYFRLFYQIVRFINESNMEDKALYIRILRATLSNGEIVILGLNCLHGGGRDKFKPLVEKYALLHNISSSSALAWQFNVGFLSPAFGDRDLVSDSKN